MRLFLQKLCDVNDKITSKSVSNLRTHSMDAKRLRSGLPQPLLKDAQSKQSNIKGQIGPVWVADFAFVAFT